MPALMQVLITLLAVGTLLVGAELFVPGGILGGLGGLALAAAVWVGFTHDFTVGLYVSAAVLVLLVVSILLWLRVFPRTGIGRSLLLNQDGQTFKAVDTGGLPALVGTMGQALTDLRPSGYALIGGRKYDVVTEGGMVQRGDPVRVVAVDGNRIIVRHAPPAAPLTQEPP